LHESKEGGCIRKEQGGRKRRVEHDGVKEEQEKEN
jgi:hypothetical protein